MPEALEVAEHPLDELRVTKEGQRRRRARARSARACASSARAASASLGLSAAARARAAPRPRSLLMTRSSRPSSSARHLDEERALPRGVQLERVDVKARAVSTHEEVDAEHRVAARFCCGRGCASAARRSISTSSSLRARARACSAPTPRRRAAARRRREERFGLVRLRQRESVRPVSAWRSA